MSIENQHDFERMEAYLNDSLSPEEHAKFESELEINEALRTELEVQRDLIRAIEIGGLETTLDEIHESLPRTKSKNKSKWLAIAASVAIILCLSIWSVFDSAPSDNLFAEYVTTDPGMPVPMSATDKYAFYDAMVDYKAEKYDLAISKWLPLLEESPINDTLNYYIGSAHFNLAQFEKALPYFAIAEQENQSVFQYKAQWYSVLSHLKLNNSEAIQATSPSADSPYVNKIKAIQSSL